MIFSSDNWAGAHPKIAANLSRHAAGYEPAYGNGVARHSSVRRNSTKFSSARSRSSSSRPERPPTPVAGVGNTPGRRRPSATAKRMSSPTNAARRNIFTGGARSAPVDGPLGKIDPDALERSDRALPAGHRPRRPADGDLDHPGDRSRHRLQRWTRSTRSPRSPGSTACRCTWTARASPMRWSRSDVTPAEMTWKRGVDILSFGGTKNGCWCAEAVVLFDPTRADGIRLHPQARRPALFQVALHRRAVRRLFRRRSVAGHGPPRQRDGGAAGRRRSRVERHAWPGSRRPTRCSPSCRRRVPKSCGGRAPASTTGMCRTASMVISATDEALCRFVTSFATTTEEVDRFGDAPARDLAAKNPPIRTPPSPNP